MAAIPSKAHFQIRRCIVQLPTHPEYWFSKRRQELTDAFGCDICWCAQSAMEDARYLASLANARRRAVVFLGDDCVESQLVKAAIERFSLLPEFREAHDEGQREFVIVCCMRRMLTELLTAHGFAFEAQSILSVIAKLRESVRFITKP